MYLLSADMVVAPPSLDVYNSLVVERKERLEAERAACDAPAGDEASGSNCLLSKLLVASSWLVSPNNKWRLLAKLPKA